MFGSKSKQILERLNSVEEIVSTNNKQLSKVLDYLRQLFNEETPTQAEVKEVELELPPTYTDVSETMVMHHEEAWGKVASKKHKSRISRDFLLEMAQCRYLALLLKWHFDSKGMPEHQFAYEVNNKAENMNVSDSTKKSLVKSAYRLTLRTYIVYSSGTDTIHPMFSRKKIAEFTNVLYSLCKDNDLKTPF